MQLASEAREGLIKYRAHPLWENSLASQLLFRMWHPGYDLSGWATSAYCGNAAVTEIHKSPEETIQTVSMVEWIQIHSSSHIWMWYFSMGWSTLNMHISGSDPIPLLICDCCKFSGGKLVHFFSWSIFEKGTECLEAI